MTRVSWHIPGEKRFHAGVDRGVLYPNNADGVPWNGLVSVVEKFDGGDVSSYWFDGKKYYVDVAPEDFQGTIAAYSYPREFAKYDGVLEVPDVPGLMASQQSRETGFGLSYRTGIGNDLENLDHGYRLHLIFNATASPIEKTHQTLTSSTDASNFEWTFNACPIPAENHKPTAHYFIDSTTTHPYFISEIEDILYGTETTEPRLPTIAELAVILNDIIVEPLPELV